MEGFLGDSFYIREENERVQVVTIATWKDQTSVNNANALVFSEYQKQGFVMPDFLALHSIQIERAIYARLL